ncbi:N-acetylglucosamine-6-phosphate deacetylase [Terriglobus saanensis]|uniref:N-acetylglucosamine-6-phosphate deacetylase n=1 Tax=Terriglobus saanensis (strain ATCC BAA-1853 / DSM 23119 / SP1PR4) TaxID=401053 RepID=E8V3D2_TERSS|nr:N-acetylglucosamine-6-phosphate deacetylase [Terriglobus saanensis]ADV82489.1 N-acetylglucosamine-6-phosphate deacetylase [Terriglobus saanensis SP1PR4]
MATTLTAKQLITATGVLDNPLITLEGDRIAAVSSRASTEASSVTHDFGEAILTAGLLDIHIHGAAGHDVMEGTPSALHTVSAHLAKTGVTEYLATTVTASLDSTYHALDALATGIERTPEGDAAKIIGIHLEGPFVSHAKKGMHPTEFIIPPTVNLLNKFWDASRGHISLITIAPELPNALDTIAHAKELGIRISIGHSNAVKSEALAGIAAGATNATHTFNAMRALNHREPGILGVALDDDKLFADLICDGIHVAPELIRLWLKAKGPKQAILITDAMEAMGMPNGTYKLGGTEVQVKDGRCTSAEGVLAGSVLSLDQAVANLQTFTGADLPTAIRLATANPARMLGLPEALIEGAPANFNVYLPSGRRTQTILRGQLL